MEGAILTAAAWLASIVCSKATIAPDLESPLATRAVDTSYGLSLRRFHPEAEKYAQAFTIENFALFGHPLESSSVRVECINRLVLTQVGYRGHFGPVTY